MSKKNLPQNRQGQDMGDLSIEMAAYKGPLPPSIELKKYNELYPNAAEEIIKNFLDEPEHRRTIERRDQNLEGHIADRMTKQHSLGLIFGFLSVLLVLCVGITFMLYGYPTQGATIITAVVVGIAASFVYGSRGILKTKN